MFSNKIYLKINRVCLYSLRPKTSAIFIRAILSHVLGYPLSWPALSRFGILPPRVAAATDARSRAGPAPPAQNGTPFHLSRHSAGPGRAASPPLAARARPRPSAPASAVTEAVARPGVQDHAALGYISRACRAAHGFMPPRASQDHKREREKEDRISR